MTIALETCPTIEELVRLRMFLFCLRCHKHVLNDTTGGLLELSCDCGSRWWPERPPVPFVDVEAPAPGTKRHGRPPKPRCGRGHAMSEDNIYRGGARDECRACRTASRKASRARQRALREVAA